MLVDLGRCTSYNFGDIKVRGGFDRHNVGWCAEEVPSLSCLEGVVALGGKVDCRCTGQLLPEIGGYLGTSLSKCSDKY